ncbi:MAG: FAD-binding protein [Proteobacteria bacterium]|nr:FAD-binding protein [Pseudomonadota bacterium]
MFKGDIELEKQNRLEALFSGDRCVQQCFQPVHVADLRKFMHNLPKQVPVRALGMGSNIVIRNGGFEGAIVMLGKRFGGFELLPENRVRVGAGALTTDVVHKAKRCGLDLTFLGEVPGTIGGAISSNAGFNGKSIGEYFLRATTIRRDGTVKTIKRREFSSTEDLLIDLADAVIVQAILQLEQDTPESLNQRYIDLKRRHEQVYSLYPLKTGYAFCLPDLSKNKRSEPLLPHAVDALVSLGAFQDSRSKLRLDPDHPNIIFAKSKSDFEALEQFGNKIRSECREKLNTELDWNIKFLGKK